MHTKNSRFTVYHTMLTVHYDYTKLTVHCVGLHLVYDVDEVNGISVLSVGMQQKCSFIVQLSICSKQS